MWHDLVLLWISQISCVWGLADGGRLEGWFVPCLAATMCLALGVGFKEKKTVAPELKALGVGFKEKKTDAPELKDKIVPAWSLFAFNFVYSVLRYQTEDFWSLFQPALVTLPLLLAADL